MRATILFALALASCVGPDRLSLQPRPDLTPDDYEDVLDSWTEDDKLYDRLDSIMFVFATFHSPEFRKAFLMAHSDVYGPGSETASHLTLTDPEAEHEHEFFLSVSTSRVEWNDLDKNKESIWRVTLVGEGDEVVSGRVEKIRTTANIRAIYPYVTDFAKTYRVRFPLTTVSGKPILSSKTGQLTMRIASALGACEMIWYLEPTATTSGAAPSAPGE
jgi:hypothetical protein